MCTAVGGHLADVGSTEEISALSSINAFKFWKRRFWVGLEMSGSQWKWMTDDEVGTDVNWDSSEPVILDEGTGATVDAFSSWKLFTGSQISHKAYPLCELPYITQIWIRNVPRPIHILSDEDLNTCYAHRRSSNVIPHVRFQSENML